MNMKIIDAALASYKEQLEDRDKDRLDFFRGLWEIQDRHAHLVADAVEYHIPDAKTAQDWYWAKKPFFLGAPVTIDEDRFVAALEDCACHIIDNAELAEDVSDKLRFFDWRELIGKTDLKKAGTDPTAYLKECSRILEAQEGEEVQENEESALAEVVTLIIIFAQRPQLENAAHAVMSSLSLEEGSAVHDKPLACPACGASAIASYVGETPSTQGKGRMLYCGTCATQWEFERIRCGCCGTQNQSKLHYYHIEGDDAHRLHLCEECGDYLRTVFQDETSAPFSFEVEDIVMTRLDAIAHDPRLRSNEE